MAPNVGVQVVTVRPGFAETSAIQVLEYGPSQGH